MRNMSGMMTDMNDMMRKMSGAMQSGTMDHTKMMNMSKMMDTMSSNMKEMFETNGKGDYERCPNEEDAGTDE